MARVALTNQVITTAGIEPAAVAAEADGNSFDNDGDVFFHAINGSGEDAHTLTFLTPAKTAGEPIEERVVTVNPNKEKFIGPFDTGVFNQATREVYVNYSGVSVLTVAAFHL